jgi:hypothetical protein
MALKKKDLDYYKGIIKEDEWEHSRKLMQNNNPAKVIAAYEGRVVSGEAGSSPDNPDGMSNAAYTNNLVQDDDSILENWMGIAADTIIPGLYHQTPLPNIRKRPNGSEFTAELLNGLIRHYFDTAAKKENQAAIIDAYLAYGFGIVKVGYNSRIGIQKNKRASLFTGEIKADGKDTDMESAEEYIKYERPFVERVSPKACFLDWSKGFGKGQRITFEYKRTLQEIVDSNLYDIKQDFLNYFKGSSDDTRKIKLNIKEHWVMLNGYAHKLVLVEGWHEEISWRKTGYQWLPISLLRFKNPSDTLYARSHGYTATLAQRELNYLNELWKESIDHAQNLVFVDENALTEDGKKTLKANPTHGIIGTTRNPKGVAQNYSSNPLSQETFANIQNLRAYLQQVLSAGGSISGDQSAPTATQDRSQQMGNMLRTGGMQDDIREFNIDQIKKMITCVVNWGDPEVAISITGKNIVDPVSGLPVTGRGVLIGGDRGISLKESIIGNIESDYKYDVDMSVSVRPDLSVVRKQLNEYGTFLAQISPALQAEGKKVNWGKLSVSMAKTFDAIPDAETIIEDMSEEEIMGMQQQAREAKTVETLKGASKPMEEAIIRGAEDVGVTQGGF